MNFIRYKYEVLVGVIFQLCQVIFSSNFSNIIFQNLSFFLIFLKVFFIHYFVAQSVFCIGSVTKLDFASVLKTLEQVDPALAGRLFYFQATWSRCEEVRLLTNRSDIQIR